jgi:ATP-dependent Clp protease ATP-binding subunit ClpC
VASSQDCARELRHNYVGTEHLLLAQYSVPEALAAQVLLESGLEADAVRRTIRTRAGEGTSAPEGDIPFTPKSIEVFTGALAAALELGHNYIGTEHMLFGLVRTDGLAREILTEAGLDEDAVTPKIVAKLAGLQPSAPPRKRAPRKQPTKRVRKTR